MGMTFHFLQEFHQISEISDGARMLLVGLWLGVNLLWLLCASPAAAVAAPRPYNLQCLGSGYMYTLRLGWVYFCVFPAALTGGWCNRDEEQSEICSSPSTDNSIPFAYPPASKKSTSLVRELLSPISLQQFAEDYWERMPLVVRGR